MHIVTCRTKEPIDGADLIELRTDLWSPEDMRELAERYRGSVMLSLRPNSVWPEPGTVDCVYLDIDHSIEEEAKAWRKAFSGTLIISYHEGPYPNMRSDAIVKYAKTCSDGIEALELSLWGRENGAIVSGMGQDGVPTRILSSFRYCCAKEGQEAASGQLPVKLMKERYRLPDENTKLFAVLGDPIDKSPGPVYHNGRFQEEGLNALYMGLRIPKGKLQHAIDLLKKLRFCGVSVTMPLKEEFDPSRAINTISFETMEATNTDAEAIKEALGDIRGKKIAVVGAGGAAKAAVYACGRRCASIQLYNRTPKVGTLPLHALRPDYDILIQATSCGMFDDSSPITKEQVRAGATIVEFVNKNTTVLQWAKEKSCFTIDGKELYRLQAQKQWEFWGLCEHAFR